MARTRATRVVALEVAKAKENMDEHRESRFGYVAWMDDIHAFLWSLEGYGTLLEIGLGSRGESWEREEPGKSVFTGCRKGRYYRVCTECSILV